MEIEQPYIENPGWHPRNLNKLIQTIHDTLDRCGNKASEGGVVSLSNGTFKIQKDRPSWIMDGEVIKRDGEKGLNFLRQEFKEWVAEEYHNPGEAWKEYPERWRSFLNARGQLDYSYNERINGDGQIESVVKTLIYDTATRQAYISIYDPQIDSLRIGGSPRMIPCILGYHFIQINQDLDMMVMARSIDANNCLMNDIWLADKLLGYIVAEINHGVGYRSDKKVNEGSITFMISNLHSYPGIVQKETTE